MSALPEGLREQLSSMALELTCPSCHQLTATGFTLWDDSLAHENPGKPPLEFDCTNCHAHVLYDAAKEECTRG